MVIFIFLFFFSAPYGRHARKGWGVPVDDRLAWILMEAPSPLLFAYCFLSGVNKGITAFVFLGMWEAHYIHRAFIYPFSLRGGKSMPLVIVACGFLFNLMNAYLNGRYLFTFAAKYPNAWLASPRFICGAGLFLLGFVINRMADDILRKLRKPGESGYKIPQGGPYRWVSCPNYLGEILIWTGWGIATWSLPGLAFAVWTFANLAPRARAHHMWYKRLFSDYPADRKALIPGIW